MTLLSLGLFGPPDSELKDLLHVAYLDFKKWKKQEKIACTQRRFKPSSVVKTNHGHYMSCKAYNGRVVLEWLRDATLRTCSKNFQEGRPLGEWLKTNNQDVPQDERLPLQAVALTLGKPGCGVGCANSSNLQTLPKRKPRNSMCKFFGISERCGRYLILACHTAYLSCNWLDPTHQRTQNDADQIYEAGQRFLRYHLQLTRISTRSGVETDLV